MGGKWSYQVNYNTSCKQLLKNCDFENLDILMKKRVKTNEEIIVVTQYEKNNCSYTNPLHIQEEQIIEEQRNQ